MKAAREALGQAATSDVREKIDNEFQSSCIF